MKLTWTHTEQHNLDIKQMRHEISLSRHITAEIVEKLNTKVKTFQTLFDKMQYKSKLLHFAFLFACPLVMTFLDKENSKTQYKLVPTLNYEREFEKI